MKKVLLIGEDGTNLGKHDLQYAKNEAKLKNRDLQLVDAKNNAYKIVDLGKQKYLKRQRKKQQPSRRRTHRVKEIKIRPLTEAHDLEIKSKQIKKFLLKGFKTKVTMRFKGRQLAGADIYRKKMDDFVSNFVKLGLANLDKPLSFDGRVMTVFLNPTGDSCKKTAQ